MSVLIVTSALFCIGLYGALTRRDIVAILACVEVMVGAALVLMIGFGAASGDVAVVEGIALLTMVMAAAEAGVGLALVVLVARKRGTTAVDELTEVRG